MNMEIDDSIPTLKEVVEGFGNYIKEEKTTGTFVEGLNKGIDDALLLVATEEDMTFFMKERMGELRYTPQTSDGKKSETNYQAGYDKGLYATVEILTGVERVEIEKYSPNE